MAENKGGTWLWVFLHLMKDRKNKYRRFSHTSDSLANDVSASHGLWNAFLLDVGRMLKTAVHDGAVQLFFQKEVGETCGLHSSVCAKADILGSINLLLGLAIYFFFLLVLVGFWEVELVEVSELVVLIIFLLHFLS